MVLATILGVILIAALSTFYAASVHRAPPPRRWARGTRPKMDPASLAGLAVLGVYACGALVLDSQAVLEAITRPAS